MKFVRDHAKTKEALKQWAGTNELLVLHFFFWSLGSSLQKTHVGMLRGLLLAALNEHPELILTAFPELYYKWKDSDSDTIPEDIEIKFAFQRMIENSQYLRLAIFVDGIDEFQGDCREMSRFLLASHNTKLVLSSRPLNSCLESLAGCPTLKLQDLARGDMETLVHGELSSHRMMKSLIQQFPIQGSQFGSQVVARADGVFLWVKLVMILLIDNLENGDDLKELARRLTAFPSDLRDLYRRMFENIDEQYQKESAMFFYLKEKWPAIAQDQALPGLVVWYTINNADAVFKGDVGPMQPDR